MTTTPKHGPQPGFKHESHLKKPDIKAFASFCLRDDIANQLQQVIRPHQLAVKLYEKETGIKVPTPTAYRQHGRWAMINGELCEIRKAKDFVPPPKPPKRPKTPKRKTPFNPPTLIEASDQKEVSTNQ